MEGGEMQRRIETRLLGDSLAQHLDFLYQVAVAGDEQRVDLQLPTGLNWVMISLRLEKLAVTEYFVNF